MRTSLNLEPFPLHVCPELDDLARINSNALLYLQGDLKELSVKNYVKLRESVKENGFMVPLFVWFNPADRQGYTLDGNQRLRFIRTEYPDGVMLPYVEIAAPDRSEAKKKILLISSQYGATTKDGFDEFLANVNGGEDFVKAQTTFGSFLDRIPEVEEEKQEVQAVTWTVAVTCESGEQADQLIQNLSLKGYQCHISG